MNEIDFFIEQLDKFVEDPDSAIEGEDPEKIRVRINQFIKNNDGFEDIYNVRSNYFLRLYNSDFATRDYPLLLGLSRLKQNLIYANQFCAHVPYFKILNGIEIKEIVDNILEIIRQNLINPKNEYGDYTDLNFEIKDYFDDINNWLSLIKRYSNALEEYKHLDIDEEVYKNINIDKYNTTHLEIEEAHRFYQEKLYTIPTEQYIKEFMIFSFFIENKLSIEAENLSELTEIIKTVFRLLEMESNHILNPKEEPDITINLPKNDEQILCTLSINEKSYALKILQEYANGAKSRKEIAEKTNIADSYVRDIEEKIKDYYKVYTTQQMLMCASKDNLIKLPQI